MGSEQHGRIHRRRKHEYVNSKDGFTIPICSKCKQGYDPFVEHRCSDDYLNDYQRRKMAKLKKK